MCVLWYLVPSEEDEVMYVCVVVACTKWRRWTVMYVCVVVACTKWRRWSHVCVCCGSLYQVKKMKSCMCVLWQRRCLFLRLFYWCFLTVLTVLYLLLFHFIRSYFSFVFYFLYCLDVLLCQVNIDLSWPHFLVGFVVFNLWFHA